MGQGTGPNFKNGQVFVRILCLYLIRIDLSTTVLVVHTKLRTQYTVLEGKREEVNLEINSFVHSPMLIAYWL